MDVRELQSTVGYVFASDNARTQRAFDPEVGKALAESFEATDLIVQPSERPLWLVRMGRVRFSESRAIRVPTLAGGAHELTVTVAGETSDAVDVLNEAWTKLGEHGDEELSDIRQVPGSFAHSTMAVVVLPIDCQELFPQLKVLNDFARDRLGSFVRQLPGTLTFRFQISLKLAVRGVEVERPILIEPRFTSLTEDRTYFTVSPLKSDEHQQMLEVLVREMRRAE